jgi:hypothetical protein
MHGGIKQYESGLLPPSFISSTIIGLRNFLDCSTKYCANSTSKLLSTGTIEVVVAVPVTDIVFHQSFLGGSMHASTTT